MLRQIADPSEIAWNDETYWEMQEGPFVSEHEGWGAWLARFRDGLAAGEFGADENGRIEQKNP